MFNMQKKIYTLLLLSLVLSYSSCSCSNVNKNSDSSNNSNNSESAIFEPEREIVLKEFKKYQNQTRYNILENYFTNTLSTLKYKNKHRIINAVKNINVEMEEAQKEFSKLFQSNEYQK